MTIAELLLPEYDQEMDATRRVLERVPEDKFAWKPHDKSFAMGDLASHIANTVSWAEPTMNQTMFDLAKRRAGLDKPFPPLSAAAFRSPNAQGQLFDECAV